MFNFDSPVPYIFIAVVLGLLVYSFFRNSQIKKNGIEADAFVSRVSEQDHYDSDGGVSTTVRYYVRYTDQGGVQRDAELTNIHMKRLAMGDRVKIKYMPGKERTAVLVSVLPRNEEG